MTGVKSPEASIRRMLRKMRVQRVEIISRDGKTYVATAYPVSWHPIVQDRRRAGFAAAGKTDFTMAEATAIVDRAHEQPLASANGPTIADAVGNLSRLVEARHTMAEIAPTENTEAASVAAEG